MNHIWVPTKEGWHCPMCKLLQKYEFRIRETSSGGEEWESKELILDNLANVHMKCRRADGYEEHFYPVILPPWGKCEKAGPIERLLSLRSQLPTCLYSINDWESLAAVVPEMLGLLLEVDALLDNGLQAKLSQISALKAATATEAED